MDIALPSRSISHAFILSALSISAAAVMLFSLTVGAVSIPVKEVWLILISNAGLVADNDIDSTHAIVINTIRLPRMLMTAFIGMALGISGASLQGLFRNPLVEPGLIGVSGGAAAAVVAAIVFQSTLMPLLGSWGYHSSLSIVAFAGGCVATFLVLKLSSSTGKTSVAVLILVGVAVNALTGALIGLAIFYADENQLSTFMFWTLGDLGGATWDKLKVAAPLLAFSCIALLFFSPALNAVALGEAEAYHLGVNTEKVKRSLIILCALSVGVSVSMAGMIGFIGLIVPHLVRTCFAADNTLVQPASALGGAVLLLVSDIISRTIVMPAELPIGVVTALIGAPFFIAMLVKSKKKNEL